MAKISQDLMALLDQLYNLAFENENVIIKSIKENIEGTKEAIKNNDERKSSSELAKVETESQLEIFSTQKEAFCSAFSSLDDNTFEALRAIGVNLEIGSMLATIAAKAPGYCDELENQINNIEADILECSKTGDRLNQELNGLISNLETSISDSAALLDLLKQCLSRDEEERETLSTKEVKDVLNRFNVFSPSEITSLSKIILFPEDGLIDYDEEYEERKAKGFPMEENVSTKAVYEDETKEVEENSAEVTEKVDEPKEEVVSETTEVSEEKTTAPDVTEDSTTYDLSKEFEEQKSDENPVLVPINEEVLNKINEDLESTQLFNMDDIKTDEEEHTDIVDEPKVVINSEENSNEIELSSDSSKEETLRETLETIGLSYDRFKEENSIDDSTLISKLNDVDFKELEDNYELLRSINVSDQVIYTITDDYTYLADIELNKKITILRAKGISESHITELVNNMSSSLRNSYDELENRINAIEELQEQFNEDTLYLLDLDVARYKDNLTKLEEYGYELDEKEKRNNQAILFNSKNIYEDVEILKNYLLGIQRKNGKYALGTFWKSPKQLLFDIDDLIEAGLEELIIAHPEILTNKADALISRITYCQENGKPLYEKDESSFNKTILDGLKFYNEYHDDALVFVPRDRETVNKSLLNVIGNPDYVEILIDILNEYYKKTTTFKDIKLNDEAKSIYDELINRLEENINAEAIGVHTYQIADTPISKNKLERNLALLVDSLVSHNQPVVGVEKEIILVSALYNLRKDEDTLKKIVDSCTGLKEESTIGGNA